MISNSILREKREKEKKKKERRISEYQTYRDSWKHISNVNGRSISSRREWWRNASDKAKSAKAEVTWIDGTRIEEGSTAVLDKRKEGLPWHLFDSSFVRFHSTSDQFRLACVIKSGELLSSRMSENAGTPAQRGVRVQEDDEAVRRRGRGGVGLVVLERSLSSSSSSLSATWYGETTSGPHECLINRLRPVPGSVCLWLL